jgi:4-coumarate--CoA ligase
VQELIKVRGAQVAPAELEALLLEHPQIIDAAVIGVKTYVLYLIPVLPHYPRGLYSEVCLLTHARATDDEDPRAYVVVAPGSGSPLLPTDVAEYVGSRVSKVKRLTGGVVFVDSIPKNPVRRCTLESRLSVSELTFKSSPGRFCDDS